MKDAGSPVAEPQWLFVPAGAWYAVFFLVPVGLMAAYSFAVNVGFYEIRFGTHADQYERLWDPIYLSVYRRTLLMALSGTLGCLAVGYPFAYFLATRVRKRKTLALLLVIVPFWTSLLIRTYSWALILERDGPLSTVLQKLHLIDQPLGILYTPRAVFIGLVYGYLPLMVFPLYVSLERLDRALVEASRDLGAGGWGTFRRVTLPLTLPGVITGCLLVFVPMTGEYVVPAILGGAKSFLVGSLVANEVLTAIDYPFGAALSMVLVALLLAVIFAYLRVLGRRAEESLGTAL